jgi:isoleucyl-tRNA synthetase
METYSKLGQPDTALLAKWGDIQQLREMVNKRIEQLRIEGKLGSSLQAEIVIHCNDPLHSVFASLGDDLKFAFIVSKTTLFKIADGSPIFINVEPSMQAKCERCWHYRDNVGVDPAHPSLCGRCTSNLFGAGEERKFS